MNIVTDVIGRFMIHVLLESLHIIDRKKEAYPTLIKKKKRSIPNQ